MKTQITEALRVQFRPEFLNRIDEVIVFHALNDADLAAIVELLLADLQKRLAEQEITLELTPAAKSLIVREGTDPAYGARPLKRTIQRLVENPLARALLQGEFKPGTTVVGDADAIGGVLVFRSGDSTVVADAEIAVTPSTTKTNTAKAAPPCGRFKSGSARGMKATGRIQIPLDICARTLLYAVSLLLTVEARFGITPIGSPVTSDRPSTNTSQVTVRPPSGLSA
jgi:hypothetical protein